MFILMRVRLFKILCLVVSFASITLHASDIKYQYIEEISFGKIKEMDAVIIQLNDKTKWVSELNFEKKLWIDDWACGDSITLTFGNYPGFSLENWDKSLTSIQVFPMSDCEDGFKKIVDFYIDEGWFSKDFYFQLDDGTYWKAREGISFRWQKGQRVVASLFYIFNVELPWVKGMKDDRVLTFPTQVDGFPIKEE